MKLLSGILLVLTAIYLIITLFRNLNKLDLETLGLGMIIIILLSVLIIGIMLIFNAIHSV